MKVEPSKPGEPSVDQQASIPKSREGADEPLVGEVIPKGAPLGRPYVRAEPQAGGPASPPKKGGRLRTAMIVIAALAGGLCLGGLTFGVLLYDRATTPDRSRPAVTLEQYLDAKFNTRDDGRARAMECGSPNLADIDRLLADLKERESRFGVSIEVTPADLVESVNGNAATIDANLKLSTSVQGVMQRDVQKWQFQFRDEGGWRLCGAIRAE